MPLTKLVPDSFGVLTICLVALLILLGLLCIAYSFYFQSQVRKQGFTQLGYFSGPWIIRIAFILFAIWWAVGEIFRLSLFRRHTRLLSGLDLRWQENVCKWYIVSNLGFAEPCLFLTLMFLLRAPLKMESGALSGKWNRNTAGYVFLCCLPMLALQLAVVLSESRLNGGSGSYVKLSRQFTSTYSRVTIDQDQVALCTYPLLSTIILGVFAAVLTAYLFWLGRQILKLVINKRLQKRVYTLIFSVSSFLPLRIAMLGLSVLAKADKIVQTHIHSYIHRYIHTHTMDLHGPESRTQAMSSDCDDDYIDMEVNLSSSSSSSSSRFISFAVNSSPPHSSREFEFQMCSSAVASGESATSPADELFYKGQLLPLHLPPRLQMVQKLLASSSSSSAVISTPISPRAAASSPRRFSSCEIQEEHCYIEISTELKRFIESKKIKQSSIRQKLKASRAYIRSLFSRPGCSDSSEIHPKFKSETLKNSKKKNPSESLSSKNPPLIHRRSFSGVIQRHSPAKCSSSSSSSASSLSSSFSFGSNGSLDLQTLMRSSNASSAEIDNSIEGAIEHCKQSFTTRKSNAGESENSSSRTSVSTCGDVEKG